MAAGRGELFLSLFSFLLAVAVVVVVIVVVLFYNRDLESGSF